VFLSHQSTKLLFELIHGVNRRSVSQILHELFMLFLLQIPLVVYIVQPAHIER
jgi:hypothetical protein